MWDSSEDERFFLMLTPNAPHTPLQATAEHADRYRDVEESGRRIFAAMVSSVDDYVGDVVAELRAHGLYENTLIVFFSDNGCVKYLSQDVCSNAPLSGSKRFHLEGGIRVPFILGITDLSTQGGYWVGYLLPISVDNMTLFYVQL